MGIKWNADGSATIVHHYRREDGSKTCIKRKIDCPDKVTLAATLLRMVESVECGSLKVKFSKCVEHKIQASGDGSMGTFYNCLNKALGDCNVDQSFVFHFQRFISK